MDQPFYLQSKDTIDTIIRSQSLELLPLDTGITPVLSKIGGIKAVVFDIYGTLFISGSGDIALTQKQRSSIAFKTAFDFVGIPTVNDIPRRTCELYFYLLEQTRAASKAANIDVPEVDIVSIWSEVIRSLIEEGLLEKGNAAADRIFEIATAYECAANPVWPMPNSMFTLRDLLARGYALGIVSNAQFYTPRLFDALLNQSPDQCGFKSDLCIWSYQEKRAKPSPLLFEKLCSKLLSSYGITPDRAIYVGNDMLNDIYAAQSAGLRTCLFAGDKRSLRMRSELPECRDAKPDAVVTDLSQLLEILQINRTVPNSLPGSPS